MAHKATQLVISAPTHQIVSLEQAQIVRKYARIDELKRELAALEGEARPAALALGERGIKVIEGIEGIVAITTVAGALRLDHGKVAAMLTTDQYAACHTQGDPYPKVEFRSRS
jgi:hypothetical protein